VMSDVFGVIYKVATVVILIVVVALGLGTALDRFLETDRLFTLLFILGSVPLTLSAVYKISMSTVKKAQRQTRQDSSSSQSEDDSTA